MKPGPNQAYDHTLRDIETAQDFRELATCDYWPGGTGASVLPDTALGGRPRPHFRSSEVDGTVEFSDRAAHGRDPSDCLDLHHDSLFCSVVL